SRTIQKFLVNKKLDKTKTDEYSIFFPLPNDYFELSNAIAKAEGGKGKEKCKDTMFLWEVKSQNFHELLQDDNNKPSFDYRETFFYIADDSVRVFVNNNFDVKELTLSYYRTPNKISVKGDIDI